MGGKFYDLNKFLPLHPGGQQLLLDARNYFDDCTFAFESHHQNNE